MRQILSTVQHREHSAAHVARRFAGRFSTWRNAGLVSFPCTL